MIIKDKAALVPFRCKDRCEYCRARITTGLDPNHIIQKGPGGGSRLDVKENLVAMCRKCHNAYHNGQSGYPPHNKFRDLLFEIVARREGFLTGEFVWMYLCLILRAPKEGPKPLIPPEWLKATECRTKPPNEPTTLVRTPA